MVEWIIAIVIGGFVGWIASMIMNTDDQQGSIANIIIGMVGALLGDWLFSDVLGVGSAASAGSFSIWGVVWGIVGAVVLIGILRAVKVFR
jgi:uncharacterized membrane protein YeaQ/YmgE (transglycosylase-associated protein family)